MPAAPRTKPAPTKGKPRAAAPSAVGLAVGDGLRAWGLPGAAAVVVVVAALLGTFGAIPLGAALAVVVAATLGLLLFVGMRPLLADDAPMRDRMIGAALGLVWLLACYVPFHTRIFPGTPLVDGAELSASGAGLPLTIPASGHRRIDLVLNGQLAANPSGGTALPVQYSLTIEGPGDAPQVVTGQFEDQLKTQRLGRRGTTTVHQLHQADVRIIANPGGGDLKITRLALTPESAHPIAVTAYVHPLPGQIVLTIAALALLAAVVAFDRLSALVAADGALTIATTAALGTAVVFWTSNTVTPDLRTLIGSVIFGGPLGFAVGALVWWVAKRVIVPPAR